MKIVVVCCVLSRFIGFWREIVLHKDNFPGIVHCTVMLVQCQVRDLLVVVGLRIRIPWIGIHHRLRREQ